MSEERTYDYLEQKPWTFLSGDSFLTDDLYKLHVDTNFLPGAEESQIIDNSKELLSQIEQLNSYYSEFNMGLPFVYDDSYKRRDNANSSLNAIINQLNFTENEQVYVGPYSLHGHDALSLVEYMDGSKSPPLTPTFKKKKKRKNEKATEISTDRKKRTKHVCKACIHCKKAHLACDNQRPCGRCRHLHKDDCVDVEHKKRGRPRLKDIALRKEKDQNTALQKKDSHDNSSSSEINNSIDSDSWTKKQLSWLELDNANEPWINSSDKFNWEFTFS